MDIRNILNLIAENSEEVKGSSPFSDNLNVMTLGQFLNAEGVMTPEEENLEEGSADEPEDSDDEEDDGFFVCIGDEEDGGFVGMLTREGGRWREVTVSGTPPYKWGTGYMSYLTSDDIMQHIRRDFRNSDVAGPFSDEQDAIEYAQRHYGLGDEPQYDDYDDEKIKEAKLDAPARELGPKELKSYLDRIMGRPVTDPKTGAAKKTARGTEKYVSGKTKQDKYKKPYIHRSSVIPIVDQDGNKYDLDALQNLITRRPKKILKQNEKMQHSDGSASVFYNIGLPALKGLAYDEDDEKFVIIDTCPGAGTCQTYCYAMKGGYVQWKNVAEGQSQLLNFLYNDPNGFMEMMSNEIADADKKFNKKDKKTKLVIRWHDAGDFFSPQYLAMAYALAKKHPNVDFYAYTKLASVAQGEKPNNFKINYSMGAKPGEEKQIDFQKTKNSRVVPEIIFKDLLDRDKQGKLVYVNKDALTSLKQRIAAKYSVKPETILTYDEMMKTPQSKDVGKWNVIVKPGDGDDSANRNDVLNTFLLMH